LKGRHDQDLDAGQRVVGGDLAGGLDAVHVWHSNVHQDEVGSAAASTGHGLGAGGRLGDDFDVGCRVEQKPEGGAQESLVVGEQDADGHVVALPVLGVSSGASP